MADRETEKMGIPGLLQEYAEVRLPVGFFMDEDEFASCARGADAIIAVLGKVSKKAIYSAERLKIVAVAGAGYDNVDVLAATSKGVFVTRAATADVEAVAEHAIGLMIMLSRKVLTAIEEARKGNWGFRNTAEAMGRELAGKTVGIVGMGRVGTAVAKKALGLDMRVLAYDPYVPQAVAKSLLASLTSLEQLLQQSTYVCLTSSLTKETRGLIGEKELRMMRSDAYLVNVARGAIVNETALYQAISGGWIAGAGLDVLELEPPLKDNPLARLNNCIITPHMAGLTIERYGDCGRVAVEEVKRVLSGAAPKPENLVNPEVLRPAHIMP